MKTRWLKWSIALLAVLLLGGLIARAVTLRRSEQATSGAALKSTPVLELAAADVAVARTQDLTRTLAISGGLKAVNTALIKARVSAEVKSLTVREGDSVKAGQVIGQLDTTEFQYRLRQAAQTAASAKAQLDISVRALVNNRALVDQGFISATGLETSVSNEAAARATYEAAVAAAQVAAKSQADATLVAPISGVVSQRLVQPGERAPIDARLIEIVDLEHIEMEAAVAPEDVGEVRVGQLAQLKVDGLTQLAAARVARINPSTQAGTRAVMVYLALAPQPGLRQGLFATGQIDLQRRTALVLPLSAVRVDQALPYVLAIESGKVVRRSVRLGARGSALIDGKPESAVEIVASLPGSSTDGAVEGANERRLDTGPQGLADGAAVLRATTGQVRDGTQVKLAGGAPTTATTTPITAPLAAPALQ